MLLLSPHKRRKRAHFERTGRVFGGTVVRRIVYSGEKIIQQLMDTDGMDQEEALEYCSYNIEGAYVGPHTPIIVWPYDD